LALITPALFSQPPPHRREKRERFIEECLSPSLRWISGLLPWRYKLRQFQFFSAFGDV